MSWEPLTNQQTQELLDAVKSDDVPGFFTVATSRSERKPLPFYEKVMLTRVINHACLPSFQMDFLFDGETYYYLDGASAPIFKVNDKGFLKLTTNNVADYLDFFFRYVTGNEGEIFLLRDMSKFPYAGSLGMEVQFNYLNPESMLEIAFREKDSAFTIRAALYMDGTVVDADMEVTCAGRVKILREKMLVTKGGGDIALYPGSSEENAKD